MATILQLADMVYASSLINSETCFATESKSNGIFFYGQNGTDAIEPQGAVGNEVGDNVTGTWRFETNSVDQSEDFWVANGQCDDTGVVGSPVTWNGNFKLYVLEKATTPVGTASAEGATLIGTPSLTIFNSGSP